MEELVRNMKRVFREKFNIIILLLLMLLILNICELKYYSDNFTKVNKKIEHRYFNITHSLQDIHGVKINTLNGEIKPKTH